MYRGGARWEPDADRALLNVAALYARGPGHVAIGEIVASVAATVLGLPAGRRPNPVYATGPRPAAKAVYRLIRNGSSHGQVCFA